MRTSVQYWMWLALSVCVGSGICRASDAAGSHIRVSATGIAVPCLTEGEGKQTLADKGVADGPSIVGTWRPCPLVVSTSKVVGVDAVISGGHLVGEFPDMTASNGCHFIEVVLLCNVPKGGRVLDFSGLRMKIDNQIFLPAGLSVPSLGGWEYFKKGMGVMEFENKLSAVANCKFRPGLVIGIAGALPSQCSIRILLQAPQQATKGELVLSSK